jgi:hypothetical protein
LVLAFFGLTPEYKKIILDEIFYLCYNSQGGFTHDEVYNMPIRYRRYYIQKLNETHEKQQEMIDKRFDSNSNTTSLDGPRKPKEPPIIPDFATKVRAPKK